MKTCGIPLTKSCCITYSVLASSCFAGFVCNVARCLFSNVKVNHFLSLKKLNVSK